jgi:hypothetical protein
MRRAIPTCVPKAIVSPVSRYKQLISIEDVVFPPHSLPDRIEQCGHALTAVELAKLLAVSRVTIFKQAAA